MPLYDHGKVSAALAAALWRWHREKGLETEAAIEALKNGTDDGERKLLFIQGDFTGIQDFIFTSGANTNRQAAKILRGRSFYVSLLSELAALRVLTALELPSTSQITNTAGKSLIAAPTPIRPRKTTPRVRQEISDWFLRNTLGTSNLALISIPGSCADLRTGRPFSQFMKRLFTSLERAKLQQLGLLRADAPAAARRGLQQRGLRLEHPSPRGPRGIREKELRALPGSDPDRRDADQKILASRPF